jgi:hypothetical protein
MKNKNIKLFEDFFKNYDISLERELIVTFRFLLKKDVKSETLLRKIKDRFIDQVKPPFKYGDFTFYEFEIDFISDIPLKNKRVESEYAIKAKIKFDEDAPISSTEIDRSLRNGIIKFLKLEEYTEFEEEVEETIIISYEYINL